MPANATRRSPRDILRIFVSGRMLAALLMGFSSGLPLLLATGSVLQAWLKESGVDLGTIGLFALVGLPYTLKFLWAPLLDRFAPIAGMGRRRGWLLLIQIALIAAIAGIGLTDPKLSLPLVTLAALLAAFFSASQDIVIDAYRRESLADDEQGLGASFYVNGYRVGMLLASGGGLILADFIPFQAVYGVMAVAMLPGLLTTLLCVEPPVSDGTPRTLREAVVAPFVEYFSRHDAVLILLFVLLYKVGEMMASQMATPFYLDLGFTKTEIGAIVKLFGFWATVVGGLMGMQVDDPRLRDSLRLSRDEDMTLVFSTHDVDLAYTWADQVALFHDGAVLCQGETAAVLGLVRSGERGNWYDLLHSRLIFPIRDSQGHPIAFAGRVLFLGVF